MTILLIVLTLVLVVINGYFVGLEFALVGSRRAKLEALAAEGNKRARTALDATADLTTELAGAQLGITMASLGIGFFGEPTVAHLVESGIARFVHLPEGVLATIGFIVGLAIVVFLHMVLGEVVPKNVALAGPERALLIMAPPGRWFLRLFRPVVHFLQVVANFGIRRFGVEPKDELTSAHTAEELAVMLAESHEEGLIEEFAHDLLTGVLDFGGRTVETVMVERADIVALPRTAAVGEVERSIVETGHSRIPITDVSAHDPIDTIIGFVHSKDLLTLPPEAQAEPIPLRLVRRMLVVPVDRSLEALLVAMRRERIHVAVVRRPNGDTAGIVTLEDLLEELVGEILDETDDREALERQIEGELFDAPGEPAPDRDRGRDGR